MRFLLVAPIMFSVAAQAVAAEPLAGEILVTATKRAQPWFEVPVAASSILAADLQAAGVTDLRELNRLSPSLLVSSTSSEANGGVVRIRGVGTVGDNPGLESSVAVYVDGVYRPRSGIALTELGELERIEVLRGPQGTLFGRNASAGLVSITTRKPEFEPLGDAEVTLGSHGQRRFFIGVTGPLAKDRLAYRFDAVMGKRDGFIRETVSGRQINNRDRLLLRGQLLFTPAANVELRLIGDYANRKEECCAGVYQPISMATRAADGSLDISADNPVRRILEALGGAPLVDDPWRRETALTPGRSFRSHVRDMGLSAQLDWDLGGATLTSVTAWRDWRSRSAQDADYSYLDLMWRDQQNRRFRSFSEELRLNGKALSGRLDWLVGGYYGSERLDTGDNLRFGADYGRYAECMVANGLATAVSAPLLQPGAPGCLDAGLAAAAINDPALPAATRARLSLWSGATLPGLAGFDAAASMAGLPGWAFDGHGIGDDRARQQARNLALFSHNLLALVPDTLRLTLGGRYTDEKKTLTADFAGNNRLCAAVAADAALAFLAGSSCAINPLSLAGESSIHGREWTGTVALDWTPLPGLMLYGSHARGYKAGGFNIDRAGMDWQSPSLAQLQFAPETVQSSELGARFAEGALQVGITAFRTIYRGFQLNSWNGTNFLVENIEACRDRLIAGGCASDRLQGGVTSTGLEVEGLARPAADLSFEAGFTWARSRYRQNLVGAGGRPLPAALANLPGQALSNAPEFVHTAALAYTPRLGSYLGALIRVDYRFQSAINTGSDLFPEKRQPAVLVVNARLGLSGDHAAWQLELFAENLLDSNYRQVSFSEPLQGAGSIAQTARNGTPATQLFGTFPAEPRLLGVRVRTKF